MYNYKIKIKKVKGFITESVQKKGMTLKVKSSKKLNENDLFSHVDNYLNEKYGIRLIEASIPVESDMPGKNAFWAKDKRLRMGGNTKIKRMKYGSDNLITRYGVDEDGNPYPWGHPLPRRPPDPPAARTCSDPLLHRSPA